MVYKRYPDEFKKNAVDLVTLHGYSVADVANRLDTSIHSVYAWIKKSAGSESQVQKPKSCTLSFENMRLKKELLQVTEERDILKKAFKVLCQ